MTQSNHGPELCTAELGWAEYDRWLEESDTLDRDWEEPLLAVAPDEDPDIYPFPGDDVSPEEWEAARREFEEEQRGRTCPGCGLPIGGMEYTCGKVSCQDHEIPF